jgi:glycosyltransferase involved in cell wall biosynthesis
MLLTALGIARAEGLAADIQLLCTGAPGARQQWLARAAASMGLGTIALFPGFLPEAELAVVMAGCLGVVFPSLFEGFGMPVIEAMAAGVPVACADTTSLPEVAAGAAILFDPRSPADIARALVALASDAPLRQRLVAAGLARAQDFTDTAGMAQDYLELFDHAVAGRRRRRGAPMRTAAA